MSGTVTAAFTSTRAKGSSNSNGGDECGFATSMGTASDAELLESAAAAAVAAAVASLAPEVSFSQRAGNAVM
jgi:hypothetical protein